MHSLVKDLKEKRESEDTARRELHRIEVSIEGLLQQTGYGRILVKQLAEARTEKEDAKKESAVAKEVVKEAAEAEALKQKAAGRKWNGRYVFDEKVNITQKKTLMISNLPAAVRWIVAGGKGDIIQIPLHGNTAFFAGAGVNLPSSMRIELIPLAKIDSKL